MDSTQLNSESLTLKKPLEYLRSIFTRFFKTRTRSALDDQYIATITSILGDTPFSIFRYDGSQNLIEPLRTNLPQLDALDAEEEERRLHEFLKGERNESYRSKRFAVIDYGLAVQCSGFIMVRAKVDDFKMQILRHVCEVWLQARNQVELRENNAKLAEDLGRNLHNLSVVRSISQVVSQAQDLQHLLSLILKVAVTTVNASRGFIMLENKITKELEIQVSHGAPHQSKSGGNGSAKGQLTLNNIHKHVMETREPILQTDVNDPEVGYQGELRKDTSLMCVPLTMHGNVFGVIYVVNREATVPFDRDDLDVLTILAAHASAVIDQSRLYNLASTDELTGLYSRRFYLQRITDEFKRSKRYQRHLSMLVIDIDFFKKTNDVYGHLAGDYVLKNVANVLKGAIRLDIDSAVRYGGEEFVIILPETHLRGAFRVAQRIRESVEQEHIEFEGNHIKTTVSIGVSSYPENGAAVEDIFNLADSALYQSKSEGRNRVTTIPHL